MASEQEAGASVVEGGRLESTPKAAKTAATSARQERENSCMKRKAEHKDHVWSYDFVMDRTEDGRRLKMMPIVDEYTRECLTIEVERSIAAEDVVATL